MDEVTFLIILNLSIGFGSYIAGTIPMVLSLSESKIRLVSIFGAGILLGTALCVIIPEGVNSIYAPQMHHHFFKPPTSSDLTTKANSSTPDENQPHTIVGLTLLIGFIFMLIIDRFTSQTQYSYSSLPLTDSQNQTSQIRNRKPKPTATIGLIVHSAADGIALGAAATTANSDIEIIVFLAIILHKAPASFALVSFLLHEGFDRSKIKKHLIMFSLSAPISSFITYFGVSSSTKEALYDFNATGVSLLFSAGTFLYVAAVHVLPEITQKQSLTFKELALLVFGSFVPIIFAVKHHH